MPEPENLRAALVLLRDSLQAPEQPDYVGLVSRRLAEQGAPRRWSRAARPVVRTRWLGHPLVAATLVLLVVAALTLSGPGREAVAHLFGLNGVRVVPLSPTAPPPRQHIDVQGDFGDLVTLAQARERMSFDVTLPRELGDPDDVYVRTGSGLESVTLVYGPRPGLPDILHNGVGLILSEYSGYAAPYFDKYLDMDHPPRAVMVAGKWQGLRFPGPQEVMVRDPQGDIHDEQPRMSAPTLVWEQDLVTFRLEARVGLHRARAIAASLE
jgi:hypothetical protein